MPIIDPRGDSKVEGTLIHFKDGLEDAAYTQINNIEPEHQYKWVTITADGVECNCLAGRSPKKGSGPADEGWHGRDDPLFTDALQVIQEELERNVDFAWDLKPLFRLQMAYLLLWSSIERYASLRYGLGDKPVCKIEHIADDPQFGRLLKQYVRRHDRVQRADNPTQDSRLDPDDPKRSLHYYYQIRSNITHRGKSAYHDHDKVKLSLTELLEIFKGLLISAFDRSSAWIPIPVPEQGEPRDIVKSQIE